MLHILLDLYGCKPSLLEDRALLQEVLEQYPAQVVKANGLLTHFGNFKWTHPHGDEREKARFSPQ